MKERVAKLCMGAGDRRGERKSGHGVLWNFFFWPVVGKGSPSMSLSPGEKATRASRGDITSNAHPPYRSIFEGHETKRKKYKMANCWNLQLTLRKVNYLRVLPSLTGEKTESN